MFINSKKISIFSNSTVLVKIFFSKKKFDSFLVIPRHIYYFFAKANMKNLS